MRTAVAGDEPRREPTTTYTTTSAAVTTTWHTPPGTVGSHTLTWLELDTKGPSWPPRHI